ncbi:unnamed protein product [Rhodiola kirilowii]
MASDINLHQNGNIGDGLQNELELLLRDRRNQDIVNQERELSMYRSGSAPPTIQGSLRAVGSLYQNTDFQEIHNNSGSINSGLLTEDEIRSHPEYLSYYYSHENINPRLPPPLLSKEDWRVAQRFHGVASSSSGADDWMKRRVAGDGEQNTSLFSMQPGLAVPENESNLTELRNASGRNMFRQTSSGWLDTGNNGHTAIPRPGIGARRKSFVEIFQEGLEHPGQTEQLARSVSRNSIGEHVGTAGNESLQGIPSGASASGLVRGQRHSSNSHLFSSVVGSSLSRNTTPEPQSIVRSPSPGPVGGPVVSIDRNSSSSVISELADIESSLSAVSLSHVQSHLQRKPDHRAGPVFNIPNGHSQTLQQQYFDRYKSEKLVASASHGELPITNGFVADQEAHDTNESLSIRRRAFSSTNLYSNVNPPGFAHLNGPVASYQNTNFSNTLFNGHTERGYAVNKDAHLEADSSHRRMSNTGHSQAASSIMDASYLHQGPGYGSQNIPSPFNVTSGSLQSNLFEFQKACLEALHAQQKQQYDLSFGNGLNHGFQVHNSIGLVTPFSGMPMINSALSAYGGPTVFQNEQQLHAPLVRKSVNGQRGGWHLDKATSPDGRTASFWLEEFKNNKARVFEISDIIGHVIEFSMDQYGSRFIQQKLETAKVDEKDKIFSEIIPEAHTLMSHVFGNYVIQKFFEHGTKSQRKELENQLKSHVLSLSLQMYGCRVIQKALEVVDVNQKIEIVSELDGAVLKCVRDQNGNHVIQKCIECVPEDQIQFIISAFYGQVASLSTHTYGCRVIQRSLEYWVDPKTQETIMNEVMQSVSTLAQDQYGNYVIQHILEHGKPHERSAIINKLAGQIVQMSQQKFASNVIEKCLTFGGPKERQLLVDEILGSTDENEPLQAMMKDQFGNYVVQKVLETCDDQSLALILSRIKVHLNGLKRYTYGKHIVSRVEQLIVTGERRIGLTK